MATIYVEKFEYDAISNARDQIREIIESCDEDEGINDFNSILKGLSSIHKRLKIYKRSQESENREKLWENTISKK